MKVQKWLWVGALVLLPSLGLAKGFAGKYDSARMSLTLVEQGEAMTGTLVVDGKNYPVKARDVNGNLVGFYIQDGKNIPLMATQKAESLELQIDGTGFLLDRTTSAKSATVLDGTRVGAAQKVKSAKLQKGTYKDDALGIRFKVPSGWEGRRSDEGIVLASPKHAGFVLVFSHDATTLNELEETAAEGLVIGGKSFLKLVNKTNPVSKTILGVKLSGLLEGKATKGYGAAVVAKGGGGVVVLGLTESATYDESFQKLVEGMAKSVKFVAPKRPKAIKSWQKELSETRLEHLEFRRSSGFGATGTTADVERLTLCKDGTFVRERAATSSAAAWASGGAGATLKVEDERLYGVWEVSEADGRATLRLADSAGKQFEFPLAYENKKMFLNGLPYLWAKASCK